MKLIKSLSLVAVILLLVCALAPAQDTRPTATWRVQKYDIAATLPADNSRSMPVKAVLTLRNVSPRPASTLTLRVSPSADVTAVRINDSVADFSKSEEKLGGSSLQRIAIRFAAVPADAITTATVEYKFNVKDNTGLMSISPTGAHFLPLSFWYPTPNSWYFTQGPDRAPTSIKVTAAGQSVIASGTESSGGFDDTMLAQPFFITGSWDTNNFSGVSVSMPKGAGADAQKRAGELAALYSEARTFVSELLGKAPDAPVRIVSSRRGAGYGSGGTVIVDEAVFRRAKIDSMTAMNLAEAAARLWLGNSIAAAGDGYGTITEGLVRFIATQFIEKRFGKDVADVERTRQRNSYAAVARRDAPMATVSPIDDYYYPVVANKGAMAWRIVAKRIGQKEFFDAIKANAQDRELNVAELRLAFSGQKALLDLMFDQVTEMNLLVGLPQAEGGETRVAVRNTGAVDVTVDVTATTDSGERLTAPVTIRATNFGDVSFRTPAKVVRVEIDAEKLYPQLDYSDDVAPREVTDSDPLLAAKRPFDKQDFAAAERTARVMLRELPRYDDLRIILARALLAQNKNAEAQKEFQAVLDEKLPTARSLAWANLGLAEAAQRSGQNDAALRFAETAIVIDGDYGASLAARNLRSRAGYSLPTDPSVRDFFATFDKAAAANRKAEIESHVLPGELNRFVSGMTGSTEQWQTQIRAIDRVDANTLLVEANMTVKFLNKDPESGMAVYRLTRVGNAWKMSGVEIFEVR